MTDLKNKIVIVTGGATGIGFGISQALSNHGATVAIVQAHLEEAEHGASQIAGAHPFAADIRSRKQVFAMVNTVCEQLGRVDGLVNNAAVTGEAALSSFLEMNEDQCMRIVDTNLNGTIWCCQAVAQRMGDGGSIVNIASVGAFAGQDAATVYCATKGAQVAFTKSLALELASKNIRVNAVAPGDIATTTNVDILTRMQSAGVREEFVRTTPLGRRGTPQEIGEPVAFLLSGAASFITGTTLIVDGGFLTY